MRVETCQVLYALVAGNEASLTSVMSKWKWQHRLMNFHHAHFQQDPLSVTMVSGKPNCANNILNLSIMTLDVDEDTLNTSIHLEWASITTKTCDRTMDLRSQCAV